MRRVTRSVNGIGRGAVYFMTHYTRIYLVMHPQTALSLALSVGCGAIVLGHTHARPRRRARAARATTTRVEAAR